MTYSESVYELAESYVKDNSDLFQTVASAKQAAHDLAIEIQVTIERFFFTQEKEKLINDDILRRVKSLKEWS